MTNVYLLIEQEPDSDEYPSIVLAVYATIELAQAAMEAMWKEEYAEPGNPEGIDPDGYEWAEAGLWWEIEEQELIGQVGAEVPDAPRT